MILLQIAWHARYQVSTIDRPREMVVVNDIYFTNWNSSDVKVFNLTTYNIDASIPVGAMPEGMLTDGSKIWVANSGSTTISEIDILLLKL